MKHVWKVLGSLVWSLIALNAQAIGIKAGLGPSQHDIQRFDTGSQNSNQSWHVEISQNGLEQTSFFTGFHAAKGSEASHFYRSVVVGGRYFPLSTPGPAMVAQGRHRLSLQEPLRPYSGVFLTFGRYVFGTADVFRGLKIESEFIGIGGELGSQFKVMEHISLDLRTSYETFRGTDRIDFIGFRSALQVGAVWFR